MRTLSNFPERLPYYTQKEDNKYFFKKRSQADYDRELVYAIEAGIDFFAHCWYSETEVLNAKYNPGNEYLGTHISELSFARKMHENSRYRDKIKMCAIIAAYEMNDEDYKKLSSTMQEEYYEKTSNGQPLVFVFDALNDIAKLEVDKLLKHTDSLGIKPYLVGIVNADFDAIPHRCNMPKYDAFSAYAEFASTDNFGKFVEYTLENNKNRGNYDLPSLPLYSTGWNPLPRIKTTVPWIEYENKEYTPVASPQELIDGAYKFREWSRENKAICDNEYVLIYAWNEFEEGGWICPTLSEDGNIDTSRRNALTEVTDILKKI